MPLRCNIRVLVTCLLAVLFLRFIRFMWAPDVASRVIVVYSQKDTPYSHDACYHGQPFHIGFGSCKQGTFAEFMSVVGALAYSRDYDAAGVEVALEPNWWPLYFEQPFSGPATRAHFNTYFGWAGKYRSFTGYYFDGSFPCPTARPALDDARALVSAVRLLPTTKKRLDTYVHANFAGKHVIGVHYRGTDKIINGGQRPISAYISAARAAARPDSWVYIASDTREAVAAVERAFPNRTLHISMYRARSGTATGLHRSGKGTLDDAMMDMLRMSRCDLLIKGRSSLSDVSLLLARNLPYMFI